MKKLLILLAITIVACTKPENSNDSEFSTNELNLSPAENSVNRAAALGSEENPIIVPDDAYIDKVDYTLTSCNGGKSIARRIDGFFWIYDPNITFVLNQYELTSTGCLKQNESKKPLITEFEFNLFYKIFGEVVTLGPPLEKGTPFNFKSWYKVLPNNQIQYAHFFENRTVKFENPIRDPNLGFDCTGIKVVKELISDGLKLGDSVVYNGQIWKLSELSERQTSFEFVGKCTPGTIEPGVCNGIPAWVFGKKYVAGDKVVFSNTLYTKLAIGWEKGPKCN
jgi:hypothetical protein